MWRSFFCSCSVSVSLSSALPLVSCSMSVMSFDSSASLGFTGIAVICPYFARTVSGMVSSSQSKFTLMSVMIASWSEKDTHRWKLSGSIQEEEISCRSSWSTMRWSIPLPPSDPLLVMYLESVRVACSYAADFRLCRGSSHQSRMPCVCLFMERPILSLEPLDIVSCRSPPRV